MEYRTRTIFSGQTFEVPTHIIRMDSARVHGWHVRYGKWTLFSDYSNDGSGAQAALTAATAELARRINKLPAPNGLRTEAHPDKANGMPLGISGPTSRRRQVHTALEYYLQVTYPVAGGKSVNRSVYIATENTITPERYQAALNKAIALRDTGVRKYKLAATKAKRDTAGASSLAFM